MPLAAIVSVALLLAAPVHVVHVGTDGWTRATPEIPRQLAPGEALWIWSAECGPRRLETLEAVACGGEERRDARPRSEEHDVEITVTGRGVTEGTEVRWGTEEMLREVPDGLLPVARTDAHGRVTVRAPANAPLYARVAGPRVASSWTVVRRSPTTITAVDGVPISIKVLEHDGAPARRAVVELRTLDVSQPAGLVFRGAGDGVVALPPIPAAAFVRLLAWSEGGAPAGVTGIPRVVTLAGGLELRGQTIDEDGAAVPEAVVTATAMIERTPVRKFARSDTRGRFLLRGLAAGEIENSIVRPPFARSSTILHVESNTDLGAVTLERSRRVTLLVTGAAGAPVAGATVRTPSLDTTTDARGLATLAGAPAAAFEARVMSKGYREQRVRIARDARTPVEVVLAAAARLRARLVRAEDRSPAGPGTASIEVNGRKSIVDFDASGQLEVDGLEGGKLSVEVRAAGLSPFRLPDRDLTAGETVDLGTIALDRGLTIRGRVIDEAGAPLAGILVRTLRPSGFGPMLAHVRKDWVGAESDANGLFAIGGLAPGAYAIWTEGPSRAPAVRAGIELTSDLPDGVLDAGDLAVAAGRTLTVTCSPATRCGTHASLVLPGAEWLPIQATLTGGEATLAPVPPERALLRLFDRRGVIHEREVTILRDEPTVARIRLPGIDVEGRVVRGGKPVRTGRVSFATTAGEDGRFVQLAHQRGAGTIGNEIIGALPRTFTAEVTPDGAFRLSDVAPGTYEVTWSNDDARSSPRRIVVAETPSPVLIDLGGATLTGVVRGAEGEPARQVMVVAEQATARAQALVQTGERFSLVGLGAGATTIHARAGVDREARATATLREGETEQVELLLEPAADRRVTVTVTARGVPVANAFVFSRQDSRLRAVTTAAGGHATLQRADGPLQLAAWSAAHGWSFAEASGDDVTIDLAAVGTLTIDGTPERVRIVSPTGFPIDEALAILGLHAAAPLRLDRMPRGTYSIFTGAVVRSVVVE